MRGIVLALMASLLTVVTLAVTEAPSFASHNRATQVEWVRGAGPGQVEFTLIFVARASYYEDWNGEIGAEPEPGETFSDPDFDFGDGDSSSPEFTIQDVDSETDVLYATAGPFVHTYTGNGPFTAALNSCCRVSWPSHINNPDGDYRVTTTVDPDFAGAPQVSMAPIVTCAIDSVCYFRVNAGPRANEQLSFRLATPEEAGGSSFVQPGPPNATHALTINPSTGLATWDTSGADLNSSDPDLGTFYSAQVVAEGSVGGALVSSTAVDFFIRLTDDPVVVCQDTDSNGNPDNDNDGLCDNWEDTGIPVPGTSDVLPLYDSNGDGTISAYERADKNVADVFVEVDYMAGLKPVAGALEAVETAFRVPPAGSSRQPVRLHVAQAASSIPYSKQLSFAGCSGPCPAGTQEFDHLKEHYFGTAEERASAVIEAKRLAFHYAIFGDAQAGNDSSGVAEIIGNDFVVTVGATHQWAKTIDVQAGTFMHELGHNLGLKHGGADSVGCKPNYLSVMNYTRQFDYTFGLSRRLDYSEAKLTTLDEASLSEQDGLLNGPVNTKIAYRGSNGARWAWARGPIDWNDSAGWPWSGVDSGRVSANVNNVGVCGGSSPADETLVSYDDWSHLAYDFRAGNDYAEGIHSNVTPAEVVKSDVAALDDVDTDGDGVKDPVDNCSAMRNPDQLDRDVNGTGDACEPGDPTKLNAPSILTPATGDVTSSSVVVTGGGEPGAEVRATLAGASCKANVDAERAYRCEIAVPTSPGSYPLTVQQTLPGYLDSDASTVTLTRPRPAAMKVGSVVKLLTKKARAGKKVVLKVGVTSAAAVKLAGGKVTIRRKGKVIGTATVKAGVAKVKLVKSKRFKKAGIVKLVLQFSGNDAALPSSAKVKVKVKAKTKKRPPRR